MSASPVIFLKLFVPHFPRSLNVHPAKRWLGCESPMGCYVEAKTRIKMGHIWRNHAEWGIFGEITWNRNVMTGRPVIKRGIVLRDRVDDGVGMYF